MTLKYEGDKVTKVGNGGAKVVNGNGGTLGYLLKIFLGKEPDHWVRFVMLGALMAFLYFSAMDFVNDVRHYMVTMAAEREKIIKKADVRFQRLYDHNGWEYQGLTE